MTNDAEAQEIHGTVVSSGRFAEPAAEDRTELAEADDQDEATDPENEEDEEDEADEERDDDTDPGYGHLAVGRADDAEVVDPDAVIVDHTDEPPAGDEAPEPIAGFARTPVASPESATPADTSGPEASAETDADETMAETDADADADDDADEADDDADDADAEVDAYAGQVGAVTDDDADQAEAEADADQADAEAEQEAAEADASSVVTSATVVTVAGADAVPEADVIAEAVMPGTPQDRDVPAMSGLAGDPDQLHERWSAIQSSFVDDPRASVAAAADLVSEAIAALVASVQDRERGLRGEWDRDGADTEDLRNTLRGYRGLLDQLAER
jgi:hypothetical protein